MLASDKAAQDKGVTFFFFRGICGHVTEFQPMEKENEYIQIPCWLLKISDKLVFALFLCPAAWKMGDFCVTGVTALPKFDGAREKLGFLHGFLEWSCRAPRPLLVIWKRN